MAINAEKIRLLSAAVKQALGEYCLRITYNTDELCVHVAQENIWEILIKLRNTPHIAMTQLMDICGADYPERPKRFDVVYNLLSLKHNLRMRLKLETDENSPVPSVTSIHSAAGWFEREIWDMFGISFSNHPDLRRILTDYDFEGHPLRKDFPLCGFVETRYDEKQKKLVQEPINLEQELREFDFSSPWKGC